MTLNFNLSALVTDVRDGWYRFATGCMIATMVIGLVVIALSARTDRLNAPERLNASGPGIPIRLELDIQIHMIEPLNGEPCDQPQAGENEADPKRKRLLAAARGLGGAAKTIAINVASEILEHRLPR